MGSSSMETRILVYQGYLRKSPPEKKMDSDKWQTRCFKLYDDKKVEYYRNEKEKKPLKKPIDLTECLVISDAKVDLSKYYKNDYKWPFCLQMPGRLYYLIAKSEEERKTWKQMICELCSFGNEIRNPEHVIIALVNSSRQSPYSSSNSSHTDEQRSGSDSSGTHLTLPISIHNPSERSSASDIASMEYEHPYDELPTPRSADVSVSTSFGSFENTYIPGVHTTQTLGTSYNDTYKTSNDSISTNRSFSSDSRSITRSLTSDVSCNYVYDVPPSSVKVKQPSTKSSHTNDNGYVKMDPLSSESSDGKEDYIEMHPDGCPDTPSEEYIQMHGEEYIRMQGASPPNELTSRGSVKEFKNYGDQFNKLSSTSGKFNTVHVSSPKYNMTGRLATSFEEEVVFDEIPEVKRLPDNIGLEPPAVDRKAKPCPTVDRSTKPKVGPLEESSCLSSPDSSSNTTTGYFYFSRHDSDDYQNTCTNNTSLTSNDYVNKKIIDDINNKKSINNRFIIQQESLIPPPCNESLYTPVPYSSHKSNDGSLVFDRTEYYKDTNNNTEDIVMLTEGDIYQEKVIPSFSTKFQGNDSFEIESEDCYQNVELPLQCSNEECEQSEYPNKECYMNVNDINQEYHESAESLMYVHCSPRQTRSNIPINQFELPPSEDAGYVKIDPVKSAAAKNLR